MWSTLTENRCQAHYAQFADRKTDLLFTPPFPFQRLSSLANSQRLHDQQLEDQRLLTMQPQAQCTTPSTSCQTTLTPPCSHSSTPPPPSPMDSLPPTPTPPSSCSVSYGLPATQYSLPPIPTVSHPLMNPSNDCLHLHTILEYKTTAVFIIYTCFCEHLILIFTSIIITMSHVDRS